MFTSKHHPAGGAVLHCDNGRLEEVIARYQTYGDMQSLGEIIELAQARALALIRFNGATRYYTESELLSDIHFKLLRAVKNFNPDRGSAFTFLSCLIQNTLHSSVTKAHTLAGRYSELDENLAATLPARAESELALWTATEDLTHRVKTVKTTLSDEAELSTQRWLIDSFLQDGFEARRHQCANAAMSVFGLTHNRSRELFDLTALEVRRVLYPDLAPRPPINANRLVGTRAAWMIRFRPLMDQKEFNKFFVLLRDLAPFVILLVDPLNKSRRQDRNPTIGRQNLEWVIHGHPTAVPLFK